MAVEIPTLKRVTPSESLPANDRINLRVQDNASDILNRTNAVTSVAEKGLDIYQKFEDQEIASLSQQAEIEYKTWNDQKLSELKNYEGDPTDAYVQYDKDAKEKYDAILNSRPDVNERVKRHLTGALTKTAQDEQVAALKQRGAQQETFKNNVYEASVKLKKTDLSNRASYIQKNDPGSYLEFDKGINDIRTTIAQRAIDKGTGEVLPDDAKSWDHTYTDGDGKIVKVKLTDIAKMRTAKEISEGVGQSIASMEAAGYTEEAKQAMERYRPYLDAKTKTTLDNRLQAAGVKQTAYDEIAKIRGKSESEQLSYINSQKDPEVRSEMLKIKDTDDRRLENMKNRRETQNYESLAKSVEARMNSQNPFNGFAELEADPEFKARYSNLDAKGRKAIEEMVIAPKVTDEKAEMELQAIVFGDNPDIRLEDLSPEQFRKYTVGLSKADKTKYTNIYNKAKTVTPGEESASVKRIGAMLEEQLFKGEFIEKNDYGRYDSEEQRVILNSRTKLLDAMEKYGPMNPKETRDFVNKFAADEIAGRVFNPEPRKKVVGAPSPKDPASTAPVKKDTLRMTDKELLPFKKKYRDTMTNGQIFPTSKDKKFLNWLSTQQINSSTAGM